MKMYNKTDLVYKNGLLIDTHDNEIIGVDPEIVDLANHLETRLQKAQWIANQPKACAGPNFSEFERKSEIDFAMFTTETPIIDKKTLESIALMEEIESMQTTDEMNYDLEGLVPLIRFVKDDSVVSCNTDSLHSFDCPTLGNPLEWTEDTIMKAVAICHDCEVAKTDEFVTKSATAE